MPENSKSTEPKRNKGAQNAKYWPDTANTRTWEQSKVTLSILYLEENRSLSDVVDFMRRNYGFYAR
jgi:Clr5 domain